MDKPALPSNRSFGWTFTGVFVLMGAYGMWRGGSGVSWPLAAALAMALVTATRETWLTPLNRAWMMLGELLGRVVTPVVLGLIFFVLFTPVGAVMRRCGRDVMRRKFDAALPSYWVKRDPPGPPEGSFRDMF